MNKRLLNATMPAHPASWRLQKAGSKDSALQEGVSMILETHDAKQGGIFIYSENRFDLGNNFKLIRKNSAHKTAESIHYNDVVGYVSDGTPKNLIVYRMMTNLESFDNTLIKYGFIVHIGKVEEVIYFDPVFILQELDDNGFLSDRIDLRFRVQQIGLKSLGAHNGRPNYEEMYAFDLQPEEVESINDKEFAEASFSFESPAQPQRKPNGNMTVLSGQAAKPQAPKRHSESVERVFRTGFFERDLTYEGEEPQRLVVEEKKEKSTRYRIGFSTQIRERNDSFQRNMQEGRLPRFSSRTSGGESPEARDLQRSELGQFLNKMKKDVSQKVPPKAAKPEAPHMKKPNQIRITEETIIDTPIAKNVKERSGQQIVIRIKNDEE